MLPSFSPICSFLNLQVTVLSEQVGAQTEKIRDLETLLEDKKNKLDATEEMLQDVRDSIQLHNSVDEECNWLQLCFFL